MADDDPIQEQGFADEAAVVASAVVGGAAVGAAARLAALARVESGAAVTAQDLLDLADHFGDIEVPVESSCIASLSYSQRTTRCTMTFTDGSVYTTRHPMRLIDFQEWVNAPSKGGHFNSKIRSRYG